MYVCMYVHVYVRACVLHNTNASPDLLSRDRAVNSSSSTPTSLVCIDVGHVT